MGRLNYKTSPVKVLKKKVSYGLHFRVMLPLQEERQPYRFEKSLGIFCDPEDFDTVDQRIRKSHPSRSYAVNKLKAVMSKYGQLLEGIDQGMILTREDLHDFWERGTLDDDKLTLSEFINHRINMKSREDVNYEKKVKYLKGKWEKCFPAPVMLH